MASRKMTFTLPEDIASRLLRQVPARDRSRYVAEALTASLRSREERLIRSCEAANADLDVRAIERDWEALPDDIAEPWTDAPER